MTRVKIETLRRTEGIKAAAKKLGRYEGASSLEKDIIALDLLAVAARSDLIIRGVTVASQSKVSEDGTWVVTDYDFQVTEVLDGDRGVGEIVVLRLPGGTVQFDDGSIAEVSVRDFRGFTTGSEYLLFLTRSRKATAAGQYEFAWGTQGAFQIDGRGIVLPLGPVTAANPKRYANASAKSLLADTRVAVTNKRKLKSGGSLPE